MSLASACELGDLQRVTFLLQNVKSEYSTWYILNSSLWGACRGGYMEIVKALISHANKIDCEIGWNSGMAQACYSGHIDIVKFMISNGATDWNYGLNHACLGGRMEIVKFMIVCGANDWHNGFIKACTGGHLEIVQLMILNGANRWDIAMQSVFNSGTLKIIQLLLFKGAEIQQYYSWPKHSDILSKLLYLKPLNELEEQTKQTKLARHDVQDSSCQI